jgi:hypothetical protein
LICVLYAGLTLPYGFTKLNGDETHFITVPYLILGGDYTLSAMKDHRYGDAAGAACESYLLAWRYFVNPKEATETSAASLSKYQLTNKASDRAKPFVITPDYFVTHRKAGKPLLAFVLNVPALAVTYVLPKNLLHYQRDYIYHPAFFAPRLVVWLLGLGCLLLIYRIVSERVDVTAGLRAALIFAVLPVVSVWTADLHQEVPLAFFLLLFFYCLSKQRLLWAAVFWGLAFGTKNQAVFALVPLAADAVWKALGDEDWAERRQAFLADLRALATVFAVGLLVSSFFGHPGANLAEVFHNSDPKISEIHNSRTLLYRMPLWSGLGLLALAGLKLLDDARDRFDRWHVFFLLFSGLLYFVQDYRVIMLAPSAAILVGTYFRPRTAHLLAAGLLVISMAGLESPYLTSRRLLYKNLILPTSPQTIEEIEKLQGLGSVQAEEKKQPEASPPAAKPQ